VAKSTSAEDIIEFGERLEDLARQTSSYANREAGWCIENGFSGWAAKILTKAGALVDVINKAAHDIRKSAEIDAPPDQG
jgi:hypothetical protein